MSVHYQSLGGGRGGFAFRQNVTTPATFVNSNALNTYLQVTLPSFRAGQICRITMGGHCLVNNAAGQTLVPVFSYGATNWFNDPGQAIAQDPRRKAWFCVFTMGAESDVIQNCFGLMALGPLAVDAAGPTSGIGNFGATGAPAWNTAFAGSAAENGATALDVRFRLSMSVASLAADFSMSHALIEVL